MIIDIDEKCRVNFYLSHENIDFVMFTDMSQDNISASCSHAKLSGGWCHLLKFHFEKSVKKWL